ncbi:putative peroxygenase 4 [Senna tora]|uniref:Putative peroxygenase 4 n=1 Tax=Senna tora TaxID=362788 RepID=A0A834TVT6_9FABA|nr:putative peroxygenase 4 [Senna tora]
MAKHGSDSGVYDTEGRFVPSKFEEIFSKHAKTNSNALTSDELMAMLKANRVPKDYKGWLASYVEWKILYDLCKDKNGLLQKETIRGVYDGSLFEIMEKEHSQDKKKKKKGHRNIEASCVVMNLNLKNLTLRRGTRYGEDEIRTSEGGREGSKRRRAEVTAIEVSDNLLPHRRPQLRKTGGVTTEQVVFV